MTPTDQNDELLVCLQRGLPLESRPFASLGAELGLTGDAVLAQVRALFERGTARRLGGVFDGRALGYDSTLMAADVPAAAIDAAAARLAAEEGITHLYEREGIPSLWFTVTAPAAQLAATVARLTASLAPSEAFSLPARRTFKIGVVLDPRSLTGVPRARPDAPRQPDRAGPSPLRPIAPLTPAERALVRRLQGALPLTPAPFAALADELGWAEADLLTRLNLWRQTGVLRRVGLVLHHREAGFQSNVMCVWQVSDDHVAAAGQALARCPEVTHCYDRVPHPRFSFNLFAMLHAGTRPAAEAAAARLAASAGLSAARLLFSTREFKKTSPLYFAEDET
jgi:DNA-binding Lrp family transcriptional regulator